MRGKLAAAATAFLLLNLLALNAPQDFLGDAVSAHHKEGEEKSPGDGVNETEFYRQLEGERQRRSQESDRPLWFEKDTENGEEADGGESQKESAEDKKVEKERERRRQDERRRRKIAEQVGTVAEESYRLGYQIGFRDGVLLGDMEATLRDDFGRDTDDER
jgi:flagellar biosynthesis/type III secretory pathway protein FliH